MIKAVIFDMFETLVTLFEGKTYFSENVVEDLGLGPQLDAYRKAWHATENNRTLGKITFTQGIETALRALGQYSPQKVELVMKHRLAALQDTFSAIPKESVQLLQELKARGIKIGLMTNTFSDERDFIRACELFPYFDVPLISYEIGICKPSQVPPFLFHTRPTAPILRLRYHFAKSCSFLNGSAAFSISPGKSLSLKS